MIEAMRTRTPGRDADGPEGIGASIVRIFVLALGLSSFLAVYLCVSILSSAMNGDGSPGEIRSRALCLPSAGFFSFERDPEPSSGPIGLAPLLCLTATLPGY